MDRKMRRNSILKKAADDDITTEVALKLKRRISFSEKKSVRIFNDEEVPRAWNNSYEESDHTNSASTDLGQSGALANNNTPCITNSGVKISTSHMKNIKSSAGRTFQAINAEINKENIFADYQYFDLPLVGQQKNTSVCVDDQKSSITTRTSLNSLGTSFYCTKDFIDNTQASDVNVVNINNCLDISLHWKECCPQSVRNFDGSNCQNDTLVGPGFKLHHDLQQQSVDSLHADQIFSYDHPLHMHPTDEEPLRPADTITADMEQTTLAWNTSSNVHKVKRRTVHNEENMNISFIGQREEVKDVNATNVSVKNASNISNIKTSSTEIKTEYHKVMSDVNSNIKKNHRCTTLFQGDDRSMAMDISLQEAKILNKNVISEENRPESADIEMEFKENTLTDNNNVSFMRSKGNQISVDDKKCIKENPSIAFSGYQKKIKPAHLSNANPTGAVPKVVLVRKVCTPLENPKPVEEHGTKRIEAEEKYIARRDENLALLSIPIETESSLLFCSENIRSTKNNKSSFRQLNDEIEFGKIQLFPKTTNKFPINRIKNIPYSGADASVPTVEVYQISEEEKRESNEKIDNNENKKEKSKLNLEEESILNNRAQESSEKTVLLEREIHNSPIESCVSKCQQKEFIFTDDDDDMLIDDTVCLTQVKLGDETASRNTSKCLNSRRETIFTNEQMDVDTDNLDNKDLAITKPFHTNPTMIPNFSDHNAQCKVLTATTTTIENQDSIRMQIQKDLITPSNDFIKKKCLRKTINYGEGIEMDIDGLPTITDRNQRKQKEHTADVLFCINNKEDDIDKFPINSDTEIENASYIQSQRRHQTIYFHGKELVNEEIKCTQEENTRKSNKSNKDQKHGSRKTIIFKSEEDMELNYTLDTNNNNNKSNPINSSKAVEGTLSNKTAFSIRIQDLNSIEDSLSRKQREICEKFERTHVDVSPEVNNEEQIERMRRLYDGTPHRSVIEFENIEIETRQDPLNDIENMEYDSAKTFSNDLENIEYDNSKKEVSLHVSEELKYFAEDFRSKVATDKCNNKISEHTICEPACIEIDCSIKKSPKGDNNYGITRLKTISLITPPLSEVNNKRNEDNITPLQRLAKKRLTQYFNDCTMEESPPLKNRTETCNYEKQEPSTNANTSRPNTKNNKTEFFHDFDMVSESMIDHIAINSRAQLPNRSNVTAAATEMICDTSQVSVSMEQSMPVSLPQKSNFSMEFTLGNTDSPVKLIQDYDQNTALKQVSYAEHKEKLEKSSPTSPVSVPSIPILVIGATEERQNSLTRVCSPKEMNNTDLNYSLETIATPRRATTYSNCEKNSVIPATNLNFNQETVPKAAEEEPITVSDVSAYYLHRKTTKLDQESSYHRRRSSLARMKSYIDLTCDSRLSADFIDDTRLSLVETLLDKDDDEVEEEKEASKEQSPLNKPITSPSTTSNINVATLMNMSVVCRKCKRCQETLVNNDNGASIADSFMLPEIPPALDLGMDRLRRLRARPNILDVHEYWRRKSLEKPYNIQDGKFDINFTSNYDESEFEDVEKLISDYKDRIKRTEIEIAERRKERAMMAVQQKSFVQRLEVRLRENLPLWIFDYQMQVRGIFLFVHRKIVTSSIQINYTEVDSCGVNINIKEVTLQPSDFPKKNWKPLHYVLDFQLKLELPFDLGTLCRESNDDSVFKMLQEIDSIYANVRELGRSLFAVLCRENGLLIREGNAICVRKTVRNIVEGKYRSVEETTFKIQILNIRKICYRDIISPPLHLFEEDLANMPTGLEFLQAFLTNPMSYLKKN